MGGRVGGRDGVLEYLEYLEYRISYLVFVSVSPYSELLTGCQFRPKGLLWLPLRFQFNRLPSNQLHPFHITTQQQMKLYTIIVASAAAAALEADAATDDKTARRLRKINIYSSHHRPGRKLEFGRKAAHQHHRHLEGDVLIDGSLSLPGEFLVDGSLSIPIASLSDSLSFSMLLPGILPVEITTVAPTTTTEGTATATTTSANETVSTTTGGTTASDTIDATTVSPTTTLVSDIIDGNSTTTIATESTVTEESTGNSTEAATPTSRPTSVSASQGAPSSAKMMSQASVIVAATVVCVIAGVVVSF